MGASPATCKLENQRSQDKEIKQNSRSKWLNWTFGTEPEHKKRLIWRLDSIESTTPPQQIRTSFMDLVCWDELKDCGDLLRDISISSEVTKGTKIKDNNPAMESLSHHPLGSDSLRNSIRRANAWNSSQSSLSKTNDSPWRASLAPPGAQETGVSKTERGRSAFLDYLPQDMSTKVLKRANKSMMITRSCSARFIRDTRFEALTHSASLLVYDISLYKKEISSPTSARSSQITNVLHDFRLSILNARPSNSGINGRQFVDELLHILHNDPECFESLLTLDFDVFDIATLPKPFNDMPITATTVAVLDRLEVVKRLKISWHPIVQFLINVEESYNDNSYHSKWHGADVVANLGYFLCSKWFRKALQPVNQLTGLLAAAAHDVDHDGLSNNFHRLAETPIGLSYPESNLEYHHIAKATGIRDLPGCDWVAEIETKHKTWTSEDIWTLFSTLILRTDPALHDPGRRKPFTDLAQSSDEELSQSQEPALMEVLHLADICNCSKPRIIAKKWATRFYREFQFTGKKVREHNVDIPIYKDPAKMPSLPETQIFFISTVCLPSFKDLVVFLPEVQETVDNLERNLTYWRSVKDKAKPKLSMAAKDTESLPLPNQERYFSTTTNQSLDDIILPMDSGDEKIRSSYVSTDSASRPSGVPKYGGARCKLRMEEREPLIVIPIHKDDDLGEESLRKKDEEKRSSSRKSVDELLSKGTFEDEEIIIISTSESTEAGYKRNGNDLSDDNLSGGTFLSLGKEPSLSARESANLSMKKKPK